MKLRIALAIVRWLAAGTAAYLCIHNGTDMLVQAFLRFRATGWVSNADELVRAAVGAVEVVASFALLSTAPLLRTMACGALTLVSLISISMLIPSEAKSGLCITAILIVALLEPRSRSSRRSPVDRRDLSLA